MVDFSTDAEGTGAQAGAVAGSGAREAAPGPGTKGETGAALGPLPAAAGADRSDPGRREVAETRAHAERSAIYHKAREGFLDVCHRLTMFLVILSSSAAVAGIVGEDSRMRVMLALLPAILGALEMTFAFSRQAREHALFAQRFLELAAKCMARDADGAALKAEIYRLYAEEPPTYKVVDALAHNQLCDLTSLHEKKLRVPRYARALRHLYRFSGTEFPAVGTPARKAA